MKVKTIYTDEYGEVVSCDDFDILQRSHDDLLEALEAACNFIKVFQSKHNAILGKDWNDAMNAGTVQMESAIKKARGL